MKNRRKAFALLFTALIFAAPAFIIAAKDTLLYPFFKPDFSCPAPQRAAGLPEGAFQLLHLYWDGSRLVLERERHNAHIKDGGMAFPGRDAGGDDLSEAERFARVYGGDVAGFIDGISARGEIIGILRYANTYYYAVYQAGGSVMIEGFPPLDQTPALSMTWEQFCCLAYSHHTGENRHASGGSGLFGL